MDKLPQLGTSKKIRDMRYTYTTNAEYKEQIRELLFRGVSTPIKYKGLSEEAPKDLQEKSDRKWLIITK